MKSSITIACQCGRQLTLETSGTKLPPDILCPDCHTSISFIEPLANSVAIRIFGRAWAELEREDFTLVIVFCAMAVECEMAGLFIKWKGVELMATRTPTEADKNVWAEQWRKWLGIAVKLNKVSELLTGKDFDSFLSHNASLLKPLHEKYPNSQTYQSPKDFFQKELFDRRNKIVHLGAINFQQVEAEMCFSMAVTLRQILNEMDSQRNKRLQA
ncbi:MAG: hypothetical protein ACRDF4_09560 [Rhabdochlamydiaceae bacterium]